MDETFRRMLIAAGQDPDRVAAEAATINLQAPTRYEQAREARQAVPKGERKPGLIASLDEQMGLDVGEATGIVTIRPGTKKHESLTRLRESGTPIETKDVEFIGEFRVAGLVLGGDTEGWRISPKGDAALGMLDHGAIAKCERDKPVTPVRVPESTPKARTDDPPTSHDAAEAVKVQAQSAKGVLLLAHYDAMAEGTFGLTDEQACERAGLSLQSEYATRCSELRKIVPALLVETGEERVGSAGVARMVSMITGRGCEYVRECGWR